MADGQPKGGALAIAVVPLLIVGGAFSFLLMGGDDGCAPIPASGSGNTVSVSIDPNTVPDTIIAGYNHEQLVNAAHVIQAGKDLGLNVRDQTIGVMTAMGESSLRVVDYGDAAGPDSRGLFQQRDNGAWGSYDDRMDPYISSTNFFKAMMQIQDRESLEPTIVAHQTQGNLDPYHYTPFWGPAVEVVESLSGTSTGLNPGNPNPGGECASDVPGVVSASGWAAPGAGPITSPYGGRIHPIYGDYRFHSGTDLAAGGCDGPIWAAQDGVVTFRGFDDAGNGTITVDHGGGVQTKYLHMYESGLLANVGDKVTAGQQIAATGSSGQSTGCHLHFMVIVDGETVDPEAYLAEVGITLG